MTDFPPSRAAASDRLAAFLPRAASYAAHRNFDYGAGRHSAVSTLSPYLRHRLITEEEVLRAVLDRYAIAQVDKFVQEVVWRTYWKGWLELRPSVWVSYRRAAEQRWNEIQTQAGLRRRWEDACSGRTGIDAFDRWAHELAETGYLHNHARMWFASIWIFTLGLPWRLGADFFYRHLLDGDAGSNTLGWRWVAGLHTRGKFYAADAANIATCTAGRFTPRRSDLAEVTEGLEATEPEGLPDPLPLRPVTPPQPEVPTALLITDEDCRIEDFGLDAYDIRTAATLAASHLRSPLPVADRVLRFEAAALADASARAGGSEVPLRADDPNALVHWAEAAGARQVATAYVTQGPLRDWLDAAAPALAARGIALCEWQRDWDRAIWPHATAGFFKVKRQIPRLLDTLVTAR